MLQHIPADYRRLLHANSVSLLGTSVSSLAVSLIAITELHASRTHVGALTACQTVAYLVVGIPAGVLVDKFSLRNMLLICDIGRAVTIGSIPIVASFQALSLVQLYVAVFLTGVFTVFADVARQSFVPQLVSSQELPSTHARMAAAQSVAQVGGPSLAGLLIQIAGAATSMVADAASYLASACLIWRIRHRQEATRQRIPGTFLDQVRDGLKFLFNNRTLRILTITSAWCNFISAINAVVLFLVLAQDISLSPGLIGAILSLNAVGGLLGSGVARRVIDKLGVPRSLFGALLGASTGQFFVALMDSGWRVWLAGIGLLVGGGSIVVFNVAQVTLRQRLTPNALLGRTTASIRFVVTGVVAIGTTLGGVFAETLSSHTVLWTLTGAFLLLVVVAFVFPPNQLEATTATAAG